MQAIKTIKGSGEPQVQLTKGKVVGLVDYVITLRSEIAQQKTVALHTQYATVPSYVFAPAGEAWFSDSPGASGIRPLYVPSLEELGLDEESYELEAMAVVEASDPNGTNDPIEVRALDLSTNTAVTGSTGSGNLSGSALDAAIKTPYFPIEGGKAYFVDARKMNINGALAASLGRNRLYVRAKAK